MTAPVTGHEQHGGWTTLAEETAFLEQIAVETDATHTIIAHSSLGQPVHRIDLGKANAPTVLIVSLQHGDEPAPRESALIYIRDLAYSTDPEVLSYLDSHRLVFIPTANPSAHPTSRNGTGPGGDVNRAHFTLSRLEAAGIAETIDEVAPHIILDMHEYEYPGGAAANDGGPDHLSGWSRLPSKPAILDDAIQALVGHIDAGIAADGWTVGEYPWASNGTLSAVSAAWNAIGILSEVHRTIDLPSRVQIVLGLMEAVRQWHRDNLFFCKQATIEATRYGVETNDPFILPTTAALGPPTTVIDASGYQLDGALPPLATKFGIEQDPDGFVPMNQKRRMFVPHLFDPESMYRIVTAERVPRSAETPTGKPVRWRVNIDGLVRDVKAAKILHDGGVRHVRLPRLR